MSGRGKNIVLALPVRMGVFALLWWALSEGDQSTWSYAAVIVPAAVAVSVLTLPPRPIRAGPARRSTAAVALAGWFLWRSVRGGVDVALRAVRPTLDIDPGFVSHRFRLPPGPARIAVMNLMNLMPGSLSARIDGEVLLLHVVDTSMPVLATIGTLEQKVAAVTGADLAATGVRDD